MAYSELGNATTMEAVLRFPSLDMPLFYPMILFTIFMIFGLGSFFREVSREGRGNLLSSLAVSGFVTTVLALLMSLINLVSNRTVVLTMVISIVFQAIYMLTKRTGQ